jgi:leucyl aminopeptidase (aminopeptidase T)
MGSLIDGTVLATAADLVIRDVMSVRRGEQVVITADTATDPAAITALMNTARMNGARITLCQMAQLPFQGSLADPFVPEPVVAAVQACDVWLDATFPYMGGSAAHHAAMATQRVRALLLADLGAGGLARLFGRVDLDRLFALQEALDALIAQSLDKECRVTCASGTDFTFTIAKPATRKLRHVTEPGTYTPPGSAVIYPSPGSVRGTVVLHGAFHEYHTMLQQPIVLRVDGQIREVSGGGNERAPMERALRRAGGGEYGSIIHLSHGFHPAARFTGTCFLEDIRARGNDAVGLGIPWWEPGGGENHPDGVVLMQSLWIGGQPVVRDGALVGPPEIAALECDLLPLFW